MSTISRVFRIWFSFSSGYRSMLSRVFSDCLLVLAMTSYKLETSKAIVEAYQNSDISRSDEDSISCTASCLRAREREREGGGGEGRGGETGSSRGEIYVH